MKRIHLAASMFTVMLLLKPLAPAAGNPASAAGSAAIPDLAPAAGSAAIPDPAPAAGSAALPNLAPAAGSLAIPDNAPRSAHATYLGFDRNDYPGDENLPVLRQTFAYTGYWLSNPPASKVNTWSGKRETVLRAGFGFLRLFNGRAYAQLKSSSNPGAADGASAARAAHAEGFHKGSVIFLDQEEGGRMLTEQKQYVLAWAAAVRQAGYRPGVYCSGIEIPERAGGSISTARDLHDSAPDLTFWVANDSCPPSPGCAFPHTSPPPESSGADFAYVWQFAQSPIRPQFAAACTHRYNPDGNCYSPGPKLHLDVNSSRSPDPSHGRN